MRVRNDGKKITDPVFPNDAVQSNDNRSNFTLEGEHRRSWTAENPDKRIGLRLKIDGGLIVSTKQNKCDAGLLLDDDRFFLVEFKGKDYKHAAEQLGETKKYFQREYSSFDFKFRARIVGKSFPKASTSRQAATRYLENNFGKNNYKFYEKQGKEII
ncbi:MAG: hypothetical protein IKL19_00450 [Paludibacteraceae bacterium]|nr:hypothetical protein [Paludibacteraceae bacterium]